MHAWLVLLNIKKQTSDNVAACKTKRLFADISIQRGSVELEMAEACVKTIRVILAIKLEE